MSDSREPVDQPKPRSGGLLASVAKLWHPVQPWVSLLLRVGLAAVAFAAAWPKLIDIRQSQSAVYYYELFPLWLSDLIGIAVPVVELVLGIVLLAGLLTRYAAALFGLMMVVYIIGIASAWARGLNIACGCFDAGGPLDPGQANAYAVDILRDIALAGLAAVLMVWPKSPASLDRIFRLDPGPKEAL